jgi:hypothetical protein
MWTMKSTLTVVAGLALLAGCAGAPPSATPTQTTSRQLLASSDQPSKEEAMAIFKQLPQRLDKATGDKLLVKLDAKQVVEPKSTRSLQWVSYLGLGYPYRFYNYNNYSYMGVGNYMYPYAYANGSYSLYGGAGCGCGTIDTGPCNGGAGSAYPFGFNTYTSYGVVPYSGCGTVDTGPCNGGAGSAYPFMFGSSGLYRPYYWF